MNVFFMCITTEKTYGINKNKLNALPIIYIYHRYIVVRITESFGKVAKPLQ